MELHYIYICDIMWVYIAAQQKVENCKVYLGIIYLKLQCRSSILTIFH